MQELANGDWVTKLADEVLAESERRGQPPVCASGLSPSGPIHLGNLREVMVPHLVADEIRRRGITCRHLISWDDFDRYRRVPAGYDPSWNEYVGMPLTLVPPPADSPYSSWAEHFSTAMKASLNEMGIEAEHISQSQMYQSGVYTPHILTAMRHRDTISAILEQYKMLKPADDTEESSRKATENSEYFPYVPYCRICRKDHTTVTAFDDATSEFSYSCSCGHRETTLLSEYHFGKLSWKIDWPMRWLYEQVVFEASGEDHQSPGSSFVVGKQIVRDVFNSSAPIGPMYAFVGIRGMSKMSSSKGSVPTPADALEIMEPFILRWIYTRKRPNQSIRVAFDSEIFRLYDEWDSMESNCRELTPLEQIELDRARRTAGGWVPLTPRVLPYRTLVSVVDIAAGDPAQIERILSHIDVDAAPLEDYEPRLRKAATWVGTQMDPSQRTVVRETTDVDLLQQLDADAKKSLTLLTDRLQDHWTLEGLTQLVYGVPKIMLGLPMEAPRTKELAVAQRQFFILLYHLLIGRDTGPRLPTLLMAIGQQRVKDLLGASINGSGLAFPE